MCDMIYNRQRFSGVLLCLETSKYKSKRFKKNHTYLVDYGYFKDSNLTEGSDIVYEDNIDSFGKFIKIKSSQYMHKGWSCYVVALSNGTDNSYAFTANKAYYIDNGFIQDDKNAYIHATCLDELESKAGCSFAQVSTDKYSSRMVQRISEPLNCKICSIKNAYDAYETFRVSKGKVYNVINGIFIDDLGRHINGIDDKWITKHSDMFVKLNEKPTSVCKTNLNCKIICTVGASELGFIVGKSYEVTDGYLTDGLKVFGPFIEFSDIEKYFAHNTFVLIEE